MRTISVWKVCVNDSGFWVANEVIVALGTDVSTYRDGEPSKPYGT